jgi:hypothetical protein
MHEQSLLGSGRRVTRRGADRNQRRQPGLNIG